MQSPAKESTVAPLSEKIFNTLLSEIVSGRLKPGDRLPSERDLAKDHAVSRPIVREALVKLRADGFVNVRKGQGVFVGEAESHKSFRLDETATLTRSDIRSVFELLAAVELPATRYAAMRRDENDLHEMRRCMLGMRYAVASGVSTAEHDFEFHRAIYKASGNEHFQRLSEIMENSIRRFIRQMSSNTALKHPDAIPTILQEHQDILDSIENKNAAKAERSAFRHLFNVTQRLGIEVHWPVVSGGRDPDPMI